jgi:DNA-binding transcriptional LysR family regulator
MTNEEEMAVFRRRLAETIAWCAGRSSAVDPQGSLRTPSLQPLAFGDYTQPLEERQAIVDAVVEKRAKLLRVENRYPDASADALAGGRLLICAPDESVWDAVSESESDGFFDEVDIPAWDTWLCYCREPHSPAAIDPFYDYLVNWVPPQFVDRVEAGILVNPVQCILWATELDTGFARRLRASGLLG